MKSRPKVSDISSALGKIRKQRTGVSNALQEYEVCVRHYKRYIYYSCFHKQVENENDKIYEVISEEEYEKRNNKRALDDFIEGGGVFDFLQIIHFISKPLMMMMITMITSMMKMMI